VQTYIFVPCVNESNPIEMSIFPSKEILLKPSLNTIITSMYTQTKHCVYIAYLSDELMCSPYVNLTFTS